MYLRSLFILFIAGTAWYNLRFTFSPHWYSSSTWEWDDYLKQIDKAGLYSFPNTSFCFKEDFENNSFTKFYRETECYHSPTVAGMTDTAGEYYTILQRQINGIMMNPVRLVHASIWVKPGVTAKTGLLLYFTLKDWQNNVYFYRHFEVDHFLRMPGEWAKISGTVWIPEWADQGGILAIGLRNHDKHAGICFDDLELRFE